MKTVKERPIRKKECDPGHSSVAPEAPRALGGSFQSHERPLSTAPGPQRVPVAASRAALAPGFGTWVSQVCWLRGKEDLCYHRCSQWQAVRRGGGAGQGPVHSVPKKHISHVHLLYVIFVAWFPTGL